MDILDWPPVTDSQWRWIAYLLPPPPKKPYRRSRRRGGRPRASDRRAFEAILWALRGGTLERLPPCYGSRRTACRRLRAWGSSFLLNEMWIRYIQSIPRELAGRWYAAFKASPPRGFWKTFLQTAFRLHYLDFYMLAECRQNRRAPRSPPSSSTPESSCPGSTGP